MSAATQAVPGRAGQGRWSRLLTAIARRAVLTQLGRLEHGTLVWVDGDDSYRFGAGGAPGEAVVTVLDARFYREVAFGGSIGAGEAYMAGYWVCDDLTLAIRILVRNREVLDGMETGLAGFTTTLQTARHWLRRNTRPGSRRNIAHHYDLGNEFFALFLDRHMMYSSAYFPSAAAGLEAASTAKLERICTRLGLSPHDHVLEIGAGWGGFAIHAAAHYGCRVTATTISRAQYEMATERVRQAGLTDRIEVLCRDYRDLGDLDGRFDKLVSIEMVEAVGHAYYATFFGACSRLLKPDGLMLLQTITIADQQFERAKRSVDFIQRYIFPGGCIPSISALTAATARASDLRLHHLEDIGPHYAETLRVWRARFLARLEQVRAQGYPETFIRMWEFYLCYSEGGFAEHAIGDAQMLLAKPGHRPGLASAAATPCKPLDEPL